jgi:hypothetical protein
MHPEGFADQAPQAIADDRVARRPRTDRHAEAGRAGIIPGTLHDKEGIGVTIASPTRALELGGGVEFMAGPQSEAPRRNSPVSAFR